MDVILRANWERDVYELVDCGEGRKLERIAGYLIDRPAPAARWPQRAPSAWAEADAHFVRDSGGKGQWIFRRPVPDPWVVKWRSISLSLKCTPFGHIGLFPEQAAIWAWIADRLAAGGEGLRVLHLFAYTGGATLAAAAAGAEVYHVDAARNILAWGKKNAELSGLAGAKIHWVCEDARRFVGREVRRGRRYDALILDPPTYGHGPKGEAWQIDKDLPSLLEACSRLIDEHCRFVVLTVHATGYNPQKLLKMAKAGLPHLDQNRYLCGHMELRSSTGRTLPAGVALLWQSA